jgi:NhaA family Na+:H+ antiporter
LAILDDLGAIVIIALFYTATLNLVALGLSALGVAALVALNALGVRRLAPYLLTGLALWGCVLASGVHATLAGVALAMTVPIDRAGGMASPLHRLEHALHPWVAYGIIPIFGFANAGLSFAGLTPHVLLDGVTLGIAAGLFLGKPIGIATAVWLLDRTRLAPLPEDATPLSFVAVAVLCGIGFTMSLFIGALAFPGDALTTETKLGVLAGSVLSGLVGYGLMRIALR